MTEYQRSDPAGARIVIGFDGSDDARRAIEVAAATMDARSAIIVHVWDPGIAAEGAIPTDMVPATAVADVDVLERRARQIARDGAALARGAGLAAEPEARPGGGAGGTAEALLDCADERDTDLVVVGRRGMSRMRAAVLGSVSEAIVRKGRRPILVVPAKPSRPR